MHAGNQGIHAQHQVALVRHPHHGSVIADTQHNVITPGRGLRTVKVAPDKVEF